MFRIEIEPHGQVVFMRDPERAAPLFERVEDGLLTRTLDRQLWPLVAKWFYLEREPAVVEIDDDEVGELWVGEVGGVRTRLPGVVDWTRETLARSATSSSYRRRTARRS